MKIIIAGAGLTGSSVVSYLSQNNSEADIVVIDPNPKALQKLAASYDIQTVLGSSSSPDILKQAGAKDADILMALTDSDEVNMVTCQMAYSLFHIAKKIARIEAPDFLDPLAKKLYNEHDMPIDYAISTSKSLADNIFSLIKIPFASNYASIKDDKIDLLSFKITSTSPILNAQIIELERLFEDIKISILAILRKDEVIIPTPSEQLKEDDIVLFLSPKNDTDIAIQAFGKTTQSTEQVLIFGANSTSELLVNLLQKDSAITNIKLIEEDLKKAEDLSYKYNDIQVISGPLLSDAILTEANIEKADTTICLTTDDKDNILTSILSDNFNVPANISVFNSCVYGNFLEDLKQNISVDKCALIASQLTKIIRKPKLDFGYVLSKTYSEVWGLKVEKRIDYKKITKQKGLKIGMIIREEQILYELPLNGLQRKDYVILFAENKQINKIEDLFL